MSEYGLSNEEIKVVMLDCWLGRFLFWSTKIVFSSVELAAACSVIFNKVKKKEKRKKELEHRTFRFFSPVSLGHARLRDPESSSVVCASSIFAAQLLFLFSLPMEGNWWSVSVANRVSLSCFKYWELYVFVLGWPVHSSSCAGFSGSWRTCKFSQNQDTSKWPSENRRCIWRYIIHKGVMNVLLKISQSFRQRLFSFPRILVVPSVLGVIAISIIL